VFYYTENGQMAYFPSAWTDAGQADPFVVLSRGRAVVRFEDLLRLVKLRTESNDILLELVAKTLAVGAYEMQVEYEDRKEHVLAFQEGVP
jgi:hypothetical protein